MTLRRGCALFLLFVGFVGLARAQEKTFPTDDEIRLLLTQTERAMAQYKPAIDREEIEMGKSGAEAVAHDRQVVKALETAVKALKSQPQAFNSPLGFAFFEWLDDADRNALLCAFTASTQSTMYMMAGNMDKADAQVHLSALVDLSKSCMDVSTLLYTVSENAGSLYQRYVEAEAQLAAKGFEVAQKCEEPLKKSGITPKK